MPVDLDVDGAENNWDDVYGQNLDKITTKRFYQATFVAKNDFEKRHSATNVITLQSYNGRGTHGAHVRYQGKFYIVPMCASENTSLGDNDTEITLKKGTVFVEEVEPVIDK